MFGLQVIDIGLGLIFVYLLLSIICTAANELIAGLLKLRARTLAAGVNNLLENKGVPDLKKNFYNHPLIKSLYKQNRKPSYIPSRTFALVLLDLIAPVNISGPKAMVDIRTRIEGLPENSDIRKTLLILIDEAGDSVQRLRSNIETWFNDAMARVSGSYKRRTQSIILVLAIVVTAASNADTIQIAKALSNDPLLREALVAQAQEFAKQEATMGPTHGAQPSYQGTGVGSRMEEEENVTQPQLNSDSSESPSNRIRETFREFQQLGIPLGWKSQPQGWEWANKIVGLLLTALSASLGAPFWFDKLKKVVNIRATGPSPEESQKPSRT